MTNHTFALNSALIGTLLLSACASTTRQSASAARDTLIIVVRNSNVQDMKLYAVIGGQHVRVGTATALGTSRLIVPTIFGKSSSGLQLYAVPLGGGRPFEFPAIVMSPRETLLLDIQQSITLSTFAVMPH